MPDPIDAAGSMAEQQKRQALAAVAAGGQAALQAMQKGQEQVGALRDAALKAALAQAVSRGAPAGAQAQVNSTIAQPYDRMQADLASAQASRGADFAQIGSAAGNYFDQVKASVPFVRQKVSDEARLRALEFELQQRAADAASQRAAERAAALRTPVQNASAQFGGVAGLRSYLADQGRANLDIQRSDPYSYNRGGLAGPGSGPRPDNEIFREGAEVVGQNALGLPAGVSSSTVGQYKPPAVPKPTTSSGKFAAKMGLSPDAINNIRSGKGGTGEQYTKLSAYVDAELQKARDAAQGVADPKTGDVPKAKSRKQIAADLRASDAYRRYPKTIDLVIADLL